MNRIESLLAAPAARRAGPAVLRVALGAVFIAHALAKVFVFTLPGTVTFFEANGFPGWTAYPVIAAELFGGLMLLAGFQTRLAALALIPVMIGALKPHIQAGWMFSSPGGGWEYVAFLIGALASQALLGSGSFALDEALRSRRPAAATEPLSAT